MTPPNTCFWALGNRCCWSSLGPLLGIGQALPGDQEASEEGRHDHLTVLPALHTPPSVVDGQPSTPEAFITS